MIRLPKVKFLALFFLCIGLIKILSLVFVLEGWVEDGSEPFEMAAFKSKIDVDGWERRNVDVEETEDLSPLLLLHAQGDDMDLLFNDTSSEIPREARGVKAAEEEGVFVITGGLGNIGMALIKELLARGIRVRCFDIIPKERAEDRLRRFLTSPSVAQLFEYVQGDIQNPTQVADLFRQKTIIDKRPSPRKDDVPKSVVNEPSGTKTSSRKGIDKLRKDDFLNDEQKPQQAQHETSYEERSVTLVVRGVFHLAGISRKTECIKAPRYCESVNVEGTRNLLNAIAASSSSPSLTEHEEMAPWLIYVSSHEVLGDVPEGFHATEEWEASPKNAFARSKLQAEKLIQAARDSACSHNGYQRDVLAQIERREADNLRKLNPEYESDEEHKDVDNKRGGIESAILRFGVIYGSPDAEIRTKLVPQLVRNAINDLPLPVIGPHQRMDFIHVRDAIESVMLAGKLLNQRRREQEKAELLRERLAASTALTNMRTVVIGDDETDDKSMADSIDMDRLIDDHSKLTVERSERATGHKDDQGCDFDFNIGAGSATMQELVQLVLELTGSASQVMLLPTAESQLELSSSVSSEKAREVLGFQPKISLRHGLDLYLDSIETATLIYLQRQRNIYCLKTKDKIGSYYQNYTMERKGKRLHQVAVHVKKGGFCEGVYNDMEVDGFISVESDEPICRNNDGGKAVVKRNFCVDMSNALAFAKRPHARPRWWLKQKCGSDKVEDLPVCEYDCEHPTICIQTGRCQCIDYGRCNLNGMVGATTIPLSVAIAEGKAEDASVNEQQLLPLIMTPLGRNSPQYYPVMHLLPFKPPGDQRCKGFQRFNYNESCFTATARMIEGISAVAVPKDRGELFIVPYYQRCSRNVETHAALAKKYLKGVMKEGDRRLVYIMVHDWSKCMHGPEFDWTVSELRRSRRDTPNKAFKDTHVFLTNGDSNTNCYDPKYDIVIPPQTCLTNDLLKISLDSLPATEERSVKIFLAGSTYGTGKILRHRLTCPDIYQNKSQARLERSQISDYIPSVSNSRFCLCPRGVAGWAPRMIDSIYLGCIPVLISDYTIYPFQDLLDYTRFAVFIRESEIPMVEEIINAIPLDVENEMRLALGLVRDSLLYFGPPLRSNSPVDLALRSLYLMRTRKDYQDSLWD